MSAHWDIIQTKKEKLISGLMEDVMDLQFSLQAMLKTGRQPLSPERIEYLLSDKFSSKIGGLEEANKLWVPNSNVGSGSTS